MRRATLTLTDAQYELVEQLAREQGVSVHEVLRMIVSVRLERVALLRALEAPREVSR